MTDSVIARRRAERAALLEKARRWAERAGPMLEAEAIVVVGSVARGDFNKWSDLDVLVVMEDAPDSLQERFALLRPTEKPPGVEAIVWTRGELAARRAGGTDPIAAEAYDVGVVVHGQLPE